MTSPQVERASKSTRTEAEVRGAAVQLTVNTAEVKDLDQFYLWLNPDLPHDERYSRDRLLQEAAEVDEATYDYFLGMLPPIHFSSGGFAIIEAATADIRLAFFRIAGRYFAAHISDSAPTHKMTAVRDRIAAAI